MSDTRALLGKIRELRQRLTQVQGLVGEANQTAAALLGLDAAGGDEPLHARMAEGARRQALLDASVKQLVGEAHSDEIRPTRLIERVRLQLERGRELVQHLKNIAAEPVLSRAELQEEGAEDPLMQSYRDTAAMAESTLRLVQAFPDAPSAQLRLAEGLEAILDAVVQRVGALAEAVQFRKGEVARRDSLAAMLRALHAGERVDANDLIALATYLHKEGKEASPLHFVPGSARRPAEFVAAHSINCARVLARMIRHDPDWQRCAQDALIAALLKDVGMLSVDPEILAHPGTLDEDQRRQVESHARIGAERVAEKLPATATLIEAIASHHERLDGTGYSAGLQQAQIGPLPRLLAVADVYTALCSSRPHRPAIDPRSALTETLMQAERGLLDRSAAERLLHLSFYPVGSVVELADGSVGVVVAVHTAPRERQTPARPVVALLADAHGKLLPTPRHLDLAECEGRSITRTLSTTQKQQLLGRRYPGLT